MGEYDYLRRLIAERAREPLFDEARRDLERQVKLLRYAEAESHEAVAALDGLLAATRSDAEKRHGASLTASGEAAEARAEAAEARAEAAEARAEAAEVRAEAGEARAEAAEARAEAAEVRAEAGEARAEAAEVRAEAGEARADAAEARAEVVEARAEAVEARAQAIAVAAQESLRAVHASTSWRLTAPLRHLAMLVRGKRRDADLPRSYEDETAAIIARYPSVPGDAQPRPLHLLLGSANSVRDRLMSTRPRADIASSLRPPRYSLVTPYFAHEAFFRLCAESVASLLLTDTQYSIASRVEWVVVNDDPRCPGDNLRAALPPAVLPHTHILSDGRNHGIAASLNRGVKAASHPWILLLDCDDLIDPHALRVLDSYINGFPNCRYFSSAMIDIDAEGREIRRRRQETPPTSLFGAGMVVGHLVAFRRDLFDELGGFEPRFSGVQDYDFALRAAAQEPLRQVPEYLYRYRWHGDSQSVARSTRQARLTNAVQASFLRRLFDLPKRKQLVALPLPPVPRGLCVIRTQGTRIELLAAAVASVQGQELPITPCVVVHGPDETRRFVERRLSQDLNPEARPAPIVLSAPDISRRRGYPCNVALDLVRATPGDYDLLCFLDDDDHLLPGFAARLVEALRLESADLAYGATNALPAKGEPWAQNRLLPAAALFYGNFMPINSYLVRTEAVLAAGARFDEELDYLEDWDFLVRLMGSGLLAVPVFETVAEYRLIGDGNTAQKRDPKHFEHCLSIIRLRAAAAAAGLPDNIFWADVLNFQSDRRQAFTEEELARLRAAKALFATPEVR